MKEPELVVSGLLFLIPAFVAWNGRQWISVLLLSILTVTSTIWHTLHEEWFRPYDFTAMLSVFVLEVYNSSLAGADNILLGMLVCLYGLIAYYWGYMDTTFCFGESRSQQMLSHAFIHVIAATVITLNLLKLQENEKTHSQSKRLS